MSSRRTIDANGNLVAIDDDGSGTSTGGGESENLLSTLQSMQTLDVFGFNLPARQFFLGWVVFAIVIGLKGAFGFLMALGCYTMYTRSTGGSSGGGRRGRGSWRGGGSGGGGSGGGSNIRGMCDLPCDPKVG